MKFAHTKIDSDEKQTIAEHSLSTAKIAKEFSIEPLKSLVYNMALLHDVGKYQESFQNKILLNKNIRVEHSSCGAIEVEKFIKYPISLMAQYCIAGHHTGIPNGGTINDNSNDTTLYGRLARKELFEDYSEYMSDINISEVDNTELLKTLTSSYSKDDLFERFAFFTRYCFSCITDADSLDTAKFCTGREDVCLKSNFTDCLEKINDKFASFNPITDLQKARATVQQQVYEKCDTNAEIYLMNMPTGSGKTLCSMKFALSRAIKTGKDRIIYVIPYNSIIDQTVDVFEKMFQDSAKILRHQSSFSYDDTDYSEDYKSHLKNVAENWNAQIIVTTSVQFFESLYDNKRNKLRKMHNMANSMIIFDEVHLMPTNYLQPCLRAVSYITKFLCSEAVFLTATMPDFNTLIKKYALPSSKIVELVEDKKDFSIFKKGDFINLGEINKEKLLELSNDNPSSLIVVNKRATASQLYDLASGKKYHLSTYMSAYDRRKIIEEIHHELKTLYNDYQDLTKVPEDKRITVISTSLIEAGVDLDFFTVYRELSGLDSILQAGGRCNREGKRENAKIYVFDFGEPVKNERDNITKALIENYKDISSYNCIADYYNKLYKFNQENIVLNSIANGCAGIDNLEFSTYANNFNMINSNTVAVAVECNDESSQLIKTLKQTGYTNHRSLQKFTFTVYEYELQELLKQGVVQEYGGIWCLTNSDYYSKEKGVRLEPTDYIF